MILANLIPEQNQTEQFPRIDSIPNIIPKIEYDQINILRITINGFHDSYLAGILEYFHRKLYFQICDGTSWYGYGDEIPDFKEDFFRRFLIINLSDDQFHQEEYWWTLFYNQVINLQMSKSQFYEKYPYRDFEINFRKESLNSQVVGWFEIISPQVASTRN